MPEKPIIAGNHVYQRCAECGSLVRLTGWFGGWHLCAEQPKTPVSRITGTNACVPPADTDR